MSAQSTQFVTVQLASQSDALALGAPGQSSIRLALSPSDVSSLEALDTYLPGYKPFGSYRADEIAAPTLRTDEVGKYRVFGIENMFRRIHTEISLQSPVGEVDPETTLVPYQALPHGLGSFIPLDTENAASFDIKKMAGERVKDILSVDREYSLWSLLRNLNSWGTGQKVTLAAGFQWNGGASSDPIADLQRRIRASAQPITDIYFSLAASHAFLAHAKVQVYMRAFYGDMAPGANVLRGTGVQASGDAISYTLPGLPPIHIASAMMQNETTGLLEEMIGGDVVLVSNPPGDPSNFERIQTVKTFRVKGPSGTGWQSREYRVENRGLNGGTMIVAGYTEVIKMVAPTTGGLIKAVIQ